MSSIACEMYCANLSCTAITIGSVRCTLAEEEANALKNGTLISLHDEVSPSMLIMTGLELEELQ